MSFDNFPGPYCFVREIKQPTESKDTDTDNPAWWTRAHELAHRESEKRKSRKKRKNSK